MPGGTDGLIGGMSGPGGCGMGGCSGPGVGGGVGCGFGGTSGCGAVKTVFIGHSFIIAGKNVTTKQGEERVAR